MTVGSIKEKLAAWGRDPAFQKAGKRVGYAFTALVYGVLAYRLSHVGWGEIGSSLPTNPIFYLIFLFNYASLPIAETLIYGRTFGTRLRDTAPAAIRKRIYNKDLLGYTGEVFLYVWAKKRVPLSDRRILGLIKDNAILSSLTSTFFALSVLAGMFLLGQVILPEGFVAGHLLQAAAVLAVIAAATGLGFRFRHSLFNMDSGNMRRTMLIHLGRLTLTHTLQVIQWAVVMPHVSLTVWCTLLATSIVTSRIPLLPARDLIFIGASLAMSPIMDISAAGMAGMLLTAAMLDKVFNFVLFPLLMRIDRRTLPRPAAAPVAAEEPVYVPVGDLVAVG